MKPILVLMSAIFILSSQPVVRADDTAAATDASAKTAKGESPVEKRISELHAKLKITSDQETLWSAVANEMRDEGKTFTSAIQTRDGSAKTMTAIDDLNSYADLASLHADSMKKFITVFTPLYNGMTADQKKNADLVFQEHKKSKKRMSKS